MSPFTFRHIAASQGCEGGYAFLAARWASDVGLAPKNCSDEDPQVGDDLFNPKNIGVETRKIGFNQ